VEYVENRSISKSHSAEKVARLKIHDFIEQAPLYIEWKNNSLIGDAMYSPTIALQRGLESFPFVGRKIEFDQDFIVRSAVDVRNYTVDPSRGINIDSRHFSHPKLKGLAARMKPAETKLEPEDPYKVYAKIDRKWVTCIASGEQQFLIQDPSIRAAEAIRINDGRAFRDKIKEESEQILIEKVLEKEPQSIDKSELYLPQKEIVTPSESPQESIFAELMDVDVDPLVSSKWNS
jgi:putative transposase